MPSRRRRVLVQIVAGIAAVATLYLVVWPVPVDPVAWEPPRDPGYSGAFAENQRLAALEQLSLDGHAGPEDLALGPDGRLFASTESGDILALAPDGSGPVVFAHTGGRPLGLEYNPHDGRLFVADAIRGLLALGMDGAVEVVAVSAGGAPVVFADDVDIAPDGRVWFTDATARFAPDTWGGTLRAAVLDTVEHGDTGRLLVWDPSTGQVAVALDGLAFANGVAISHDGRSVLVVETNAYRVLRYWIGGPRAGEVEPVLEALPGFPDNIARGPNGLYWVGLVSGRKWVIDATAPFPALRASVLRLPQALRPEPTRYGHVIAFDDTGQLVHNLQDPAGGFPKTTGALHTEEWLFVTSLSAAALGRLPVSALR